MENLGWLRFLRIMRIMRPLALDWPQALKWLSLKIGGSFCGSRIRALLLWVKIRTPCFWKLAVAKDYAAKIRKDVASSSTTACLCLGGGHGRPPLQFLSFWLTPGDCPQMALVERVPVSSGSDCNTGSFYTCPAFREHVSLGQRSVPRSSGRRGHALFRGFSLVSSPASAIGRALKACLAS